MGSGKIDTTFHQGTKLAEIGIETAQERPTGQLSDLVSHQPRFVIAIAQPLENIIMALEVRRIGCRDALMHS